MTNKILFNSNRFLTKIFQKQTFFNFFSENSRCPKKSICMETWSKIILAQRTPNLTKKMLLNLNPPSEISQKHAFFLKITDVQKQNCTWLEIWTKIFSYQRFQKCPQKMFLNQNPLSGLKRDFKETSVFFEKITNVQKKKTWPKN